MKFKVCDLGVTASRSTNACFWLCIAAAWSMVVPDAFWEGAPLGLRAMAHLAASIRLGGAESLSRARRPASGRDLVGQLAQALRNYFCAPGGVMSSEEETGLLFPAFAALTSGSNASRMENYRNWVRRVGQDGFADELVASCVARHLHVRLIIVPYSPPTAMRPWSIVELPCAEHCGVLGIDEATRVVLGNDNIHYVWLAPTVAGGVSS